MFYWFTVSQAITNWLHKTIKIYLGAVILQTFKNFSKFVAVGARTVWWDFVVCHEIQYLSSTIPA